MGSISSLLLWDVVVPAVIGTVELVIWHRIWLRHTYAGMPKRYVSSTWQRRLVLPVFIAVLLWWFVIAVLWGLRLAVDPYLDKDTSQSVIPAPLMIVMLAAGYWVMIMLIYTWADGICQKFIAPRFLYSDPKIYPDGEPAHEGHDHGFDSHCGFEGHHGFDAPGGHL